LRAEHQQHQCFDCIIGPLASPSPSGSDLLFYNQNRLQVAMMTARDVRSMTAIEFLAGGVFAAATEEEKPECNQGSGERHWLT
jgi:hypothetical protein